MVASIQTSGAPVRRSRRRDWIFPATRACPLRGPGSGHLPGERALLRPGPLRFSGGSRGVLARGRWPARGVCLADNDLFQAALLVAGVSLIFATRRGPARGGGLGRGCRDGQALCTLSGHLVGRPRPSTELIQLRIDPKEIEGFPSFPSGHTVHYTVFFGFLAFLAFTRVKHTALSWAPGLLRRAGAPGWAGHIPRAHWISDVVGGYLLGGAVLAIGVFYDLRWSHRSGNPESNPSRRGRATSLRELRPLV